MRIVVSGGGTAGHISPILATADAFASLGKAVELLYVGQTGGLEQRIATAAGLEFAGIAAGKWRRNQGKSKLAQLTDFGNLGLNVRDSARVARGYTQALRLLRRFKPEVVFI